LNNSDFKVLISARDRSAFQDIASERIIVVPRRPWAVFRAISKAEIVVQGGGTIFHDSYSQKIKLLRYWVNLALWVSIFLWSRICGCRTLMLGVGLVPQKYWPTRILTGAALRLMHGVMVRDNASLEVAQRYCAGEQVVLAPDLSFDAPINRLSADNQSDELAQPVDLAISLCDLAQFYGDRNHDQKYWQNLAAAINNLASKNSAQYKVALLNFFTGPNRHDGIAARDFAAMLNSDQIDIQILDYETDPRPILRIIRRCELFIATRFHAAVTGYILQRRLLLIAYNRKLNDFADIIQLPATLIIPINHLVSEDEWLASIEHALDLAEAEISREHGIVSDLEQNLDQILFGFSS